MAPYRLTTSRYGGSVVNSSSRSPRLVPAHHLSMLAHAFLAVSARALRPAPPEPPPASADAGGEPGEKGAVACG
ncbi:MAG: hypothetical protein ACLQB1_37660, partial [Streptosporangiaceae bacterium]